ncbi:MAG TPA: cytochrome c [Terriglobia bacterium]|nr:cytochrome c [Terriglobia bacterium]
MNSRNSRLPSSLAFCEIFAVLILAGCASLPGRPGPGPEVVRPDEVLDFNTLYKQNCSGCHGTGGKGGAAVSIGDPVYQALVDDAALHRIITNGLPGTLMPAWGRSAGGLLTEQQINVLIQGMRAHWADPSALNGDVPPPYTPSAPGDATRGADVYQTFCAMCHGPGGRGGPVARSIVDGSFLGLVTDQELRTMIIVGVPGTAMPNWRNRAPRPMSSEEISDVVAWLAAQRPQFPGQPYASQAGSAGVSPALSSWSATRPAATARETPALPGFGPATGGS